MIKSPKEIHLSAENFEKMTNLELLIKYNPHISGDHLIPPLPSKCKFLDWSKDSTRNVRADSAAQGNLYSSFVS